MAEILFKNGQKLIVSDDTWIKLHKRFTEIGGVVKWAIFTTYEGEVIYIFNMEEICYVSLEDRRIKKLLKEI